MNAFSKGDRILRFKCVYQAQRHLGLGDRTEVARLEVTWPGNKTQVLLDLPVNRYVTVREDDGTWYSIDSD